MHPFKVTDADIVYGSRFIGEQYVRLHFFWHYIANKILTLFTNIMSNLNMSDMETGYKVFKRSVIQSIKIKENLFGVEPKITVKLAKKNLFFMKSPFLIKEDHTKREKNYFKRCICCHLLHFKISSF